MIGHASSSFRPPARPTAPVTPTATYLLQTTCTHTHARTDVPTHAHAHTHAYACTHARIRTHAYARTRCTLADQCVTNHPTGIWVACANTGRCSLPRRSGSSLPRSHAPLSSTKRTWTTSSAPAFLACKALESLLHISARWRPLRERERSLGWLPVLVHTRTGEQRVPRLLRVRCSQFGACWIRPYCVGRFGTFLFDSERQRAMHNVHTATESIWDQVWRWGAHGLAQPPYRSPQWNRC